MLNIGSLAGFSTYAMGINNSGQVAGYSYVNVPGAFTLHAFLYSGGQILDLGTLPGGTWSDAFGINDLGQVVGEALTATGAYDAFLYSGGLMQDLGTLPGGNGSVAYGINNQGQVVGQSNTVSGAADAFIYSQGKMQNLNSLISPGSGWTLEGALAINAAGQIVGFGLHNGQTEAFLLTPPLGHWRTLVPVRRFR